MLILGYLVATIYFAAFLTYTGIVLLYLGTDGWNLPIQSSWTSWKCFYNITNLQEYFIIVIAGNVIGEVPVVIILYTVLTVIILPILYREYRHLQIN